MTIALVGELSSRTHVGKWFDPVKVECTGLCPALPRCKRYYHVLCGLERVLADFALHFACANGFHVIASKPLLTRQGGCCHSGYLYRFKLYAVTNLQGSIYCSAVASANEYDVVLIKHLLTGPGTLVASDKSCAGRKAYARLGNDECHGSRQGYRVDDLCAAPTAERLVA